MFVGGGVQRPKWGERAGDGDRVWLRRQESPLRRHTHRWKAEGGTKALIALMHTHSHTRLTQYPCAEFSFLALLDVFGCVCLYIRVTCEHCAVNIALIDRGQAALPDGRLGSCCLFIHCCWGAATTAAAYIWGVMLCAGCIVCAGYMLASQGQDYTHACDMLPSVFVVWVYAEA